jgi:hypothetical protein
MIWSCWTRYLWLQPRPGCWQRIVTVGPGCSCVMVTVGAGRATVTVRTGCGTGTSIVTVGVGLRPCRGLVAPRTSGTVIATISARPSAATIVSKPLDSGRFRALLRWLRPGRGACGVITPLMVDRGVARRGDTASDGAVRAARTELWRMHDLIALYASQESLGHAEADGREQAIDRLLGYWLRSASAADLHFQVLRDDDVPAQFSDRERALAWLDAERANFVPAVQLAAATGRNGVALLLPARLAECLAWRRLFDDKIDIATVSLHAARRLDDKEHEVIALISLSSALASTARYDEAIAACHDATTVARQIGDQHREAMALNNLCGALIESGRHDQAIATIQEVITVHRQLGDRTCRGHGGGQPRLGDARIPALRRNS